MKTIQSRSIIQLSAIALLSLIPLGCSPSVTANSPESKTEKSIAKTESTKPNESAAAIDESVGEVPVIKVADNPDIQNLSLQKEMPYEEAREIILKAGWQPNLDESRKDLRDQRVKRMFEGEYKEIESCSGTGEAPCRYSFTNLHREILSVTTNTRPRQSVLRDWWLETNENKRSKSPAATKKFVDGDYRDGLDNGELGLEIQGSQYRHTSEMGPQEWRSIRQLKFVKEGVVLDEEQHHWCLSSLIPPNQNRNQRVVCSEDGWVRPKAENPQTNLPFIGKKRFNFMGGSGTGQTITIESNGQTIIQLHGTQSNSTQFSGKFSDLEREMGLRVQGDTIFNIDAKGDICSSNDPDRAPCKTNLY